MEERFLIAIVPPNELLSKITKLKKEISENFGSSHALNAPAHITLHMPFKLTDKKRRTLSTLVTSINSQIKPFGILLKGFDFFEPRVVFIAVEENDQLSNLQKELMRRCRRELKLDNANYRNRAFRPHVTIGFRDLKKAAFFKAKEHFEARDFFEEFKVTKISLLKRNGKIWEIVD